MLRPIEMATIRDVAKRAGVSVGTVSNYLNDPTRVAPATAERVQQAIDVLEYRIDLTARAFRTGQTRTIGLLVPTITNPYFAEIAKVISHELWAEGYQVFLADADDDPERELALVEQLLARRVEGMLVIHSGDPEAYAPRVYEAGVPLVFFDRNVPGYPSVSTDNRLGGALAARHLTDLGHRDIAVLVGGGSARNVAERLEGFREALAAADVELEARSILAGPQALELGYRVTELLHRSPRPSAIFATNDIVAIGAWRTLVGLGVAVPDDVSLVGFDGIEMSRLTVPPLTTVHQDKGSVGRAAVALLLRCLRGEAVEPDSVCIPPRLTPRASSASRAPSARADAAD